MDLELDDDKAKIEERLYKAFGGRAALPSSQKAKFSSWILAFKKSGGRVIMRVSFLAMWFSKCVFSYYPAQFIKPLHLSSRHKAFPRYVLTIRCFIFRLPLLGIRPTSL